jgi:hypothetical protein
MKPIDVQQLLGAWQLKRWVVDYSDNRPSEHPFGFDAIGLIVYETSGWMSAMLSRRSRSPLSAASAHQADLASKARALDEYLVYTARWRVEGQEVVHHVTSALNPVLIGTEQRRAAVREGDELRLTAVEHLRRGGSTLQRTHLLHWYQEMR